jgi:hypothetical protein
VFLILFKTIFIFHKRNICFKIKFFGNENKFIEFLFKNLKTQTLFDKLKTIPKVFFSLFSSYFTGFKKKKIKLN